MPKKLDLAGRKFGLWTVLGRGRPILSGTVGKPINDTTWVCQCQCGVRREVRTKFLTAGLSKSCGCLRRMSVADRAIAIEDAMAELPPEDQIERSLPPL
jgi:hypothetical protein